MMSKDEFKENLEADLDYEESQGSSGQFSSAEERDEIKEVQKMSRKDNLLVQGWRIATTVVLLVTAFIVAYTTYRFLKTEEQQSFEDAFDKFSSTVRTAALDQQRNIRNAFKSFSAIFEGYAYETNQSFPFVKLPLFEMYAKNHLIMGGAEAYCVWNVVPKEKYEEYIEWTNATHEDWIKEGHMIRYGHLDRFKANDTQYHPFITRKGEAGFEPDEDRPEYWASWTYSPPPSSAGVVNFNLASLPDINQLVEVLKELKNETLVSMVQHYSTVPLAMTYEEHDAMHSILLDSDSQYPHSFFYYPIHIRPNEPQSEVVAMISAGVAWDASFRNLLPEGVEGFNVVVKNNCNQSYSYEIIGKDAVFIGEGDIHDSKYDHMEVVVDLALHEHPNFTKREGHCRYSMHIFPSDKFAKSYDENTPEIYATVVAITFAIVAIVFYVYDLFVQKRNERLVAKAAQSNAIVSNLFPDMIRNRLMEEEEHAQVLKSKKKGNLKAFLNAGGQGGTDEQARPLADLYLETTVLFADISGFTAWSSSRDPTQVFILLETLFQAFDSLAKKRRIFKVETVGDCYVAVCGLPEPRADHAVAMARFARDILAQMRARTKEMEVTLGPDTADLSLRVAIHSGPVTAGVLRGERARFQLFGDTMNTCARLESTGERNRIHCSKETANLITKTGKGAWLEKRTDVVSGKGKGVMETYWVNVYGDRAGSVASISNSGDLQGLDSTPAYGKPFPGLSERTHRLIDWNVEMLLRIVKQIVAYRGTKTIDQSTHRKSMSAAKTNLLQIETAATPLEEVQEIIVLPEFDSHATKRQQKPDEVAVPKEVIQQLHHLVSMIACMYNDNPFHNFDHASHVVMSVIKLMSRIVAPSHLEDLDECESKQQKRMVAASLHDHTYGITSDPLTQFACAFSALIHDVDHQGVSNVQLVTEGGPLLTRYGERSVAEQNSLDLSWDLLMRDDYIVLRSFLFPTHAELVRFRKLVVNSVMSTDIVDKDLKALRNGRWDKAFKKGDCAGHVDENPRDEINRKATIVIEHIIQASDISHTMQHWHVYRKWNQNLFEELYVAYLNGRMEKDPSSFWYQGEFGFFDYYIIPLTQKLKDCGVFGVSSDEYLNYAIKNREEWAARGEEVVAEMIAEAHSKYGTKEEATVKPEQAPCSFDC